jgi:TrmH family RNA methyltransferase
MIKITSKTNERIKSLKKLLEDKAFRYEQKEFAVEGLRALEDIKDVSELFVREDVQPPEIAAKKIYEVAKSVFESVSSTENSQGIMAVTGMNVLGAEDISKDSKYVLLDRLQDPGNMGTIIRTACAFGFKGIMITPGCVDPFSPKVVRACASALWKIDIINIEGVEELKELPIIAAGLEGADATDFKWPTGFALAIGNEARGLSDEILNASKEKVSIPTASGINSLNAAVSAGILMFCSQKQLDKTRSR